MTEKPPELLIIDHQNGTKEPVGFFCIRRNDKPYLAKSKDPKTPMPRIWNSFDEARMFVEKESRGNVTIGVAQISPFKQPILWFAMPTNGGKDSFDISYVGSFRYNNGRLVDVMAVGTPMEDIDGTTERAQ